MKKHKVPVTEFDLAVGVFLFACGWAVALLGKAYLTTLLLSLLLIAFGFSLIIEYFSVNKQNQKYLVWLPLFIGVIFIDKWPSEEVTEKLALSNAFWHLITALPVVVLFI